MPVSTNGPNGVQPMHETLDETEASSSAALDPSIGGVSTAWLLERKDRLLRQLVASKPMRYTETIGRLQGHACRSLNLTNLFKWDPTRIVCAVNLHGHDRPVRSMTVINGELATGAEDGVVHIWDLQDMVEPRVTIRDPSNHASCTALAVSYDGLLLTAGDRGAVHLWNVNEKLIINSLVGGHTDQVRCMLVTDVDRLTHEVAPPVTLSSVLDVSQQPQTAGSSQPQSRPSTSGSVGGRPFEPIPPQSKFASHAAEIDPIRSAAARARELLMAQTDTRLSVLITGSADQTLRVWHLETLDCLATLTGHTATVNSMVIIDKELFTGSDDGTIRRWDMLRKGFPCSATFTSQPKSTITALLCMRSSTLLSAGSSGVVDVWSTVESRKLTTLDDGRHAAITTMARLDDDLFATASADHAIALWSIGELACIQVFPCSALCLFAVDNLLFSGGAMNVVKMWTSQCLVLNERKYEKQRQIEESETRPATSEKALTKLPTD